jgi:opacity protein-like surface antigen
MRAVLKYSILFSILLSQGLIVAQSFSVKPYISYATVQMKEVNEGTEGRVESLRELTGVYVPTPDPFKGNYAWGIQIGYHLEDNYFLTFGTYFYRENRDFNYQDNSQGYLVLFDNNRSIRLFEASFGMKYFIRYSSWKRFNFYVGGGIGFALGWSETLFSYSDETNYVNNIGEFSSNALTGHLLAGLSIRFSPTISLEPEFGYRMANLSQMEGTLRFSQDFPNALPQQEGVDNQFTTEENYNFSGFFVNLGLQFLINL